MKVLPRRDLDRIHPYQPGKPVEEVARELGIKGEIIKLASNENPLGMSPKAREAAKRYLEEGYLYPDDQGFYLKEKLAKKHKVDPDMIILGNGSVDLIYLVCLAYLESNNNLIMTKGSFIIAKIATYIAGARLIEVPPRDDMTHNFEGILKSINKDTKLIFLDNPINPLGTISTKEDFDEFMGEVPDNVLVISDEAYYDYITDADYIDSMRYLREGRNILIFHTFSKIYGMAGLRIGYGIAKPEIIQALMKVRLPFNTNRLGQIAALAALDDREHVKRSIEVNERGKEYLYKEFKRLGLFYLPTHANFIFVDFKRDAREVFEALQRQGVITRPIPQYGFPTALRITIGNEHQNQRLIEALERVI